MKKWIIAICVTVSVLTLGYVCAGFLTGNVYFDSDVLQSHTVEVFGEYSADEQIEATVEFPLFFGAKLTVAAECVNNVNTDKLGDYSVDYSAKFLNNSANIKCTVSVVDTVAPTIELEERFFEINADQRPVMPEKVTVAFSATDNYDGDVTANVERIVEDNVCYIRVRDTSGNIAEEKVDLIFIDSRGPELKLKGNGTVYMPVNTAYKELGYTVSDNYDKDIASKVKVTSNVDMSNRGTYVVTYSVSDSAGNSTTLTRRVIVYGGGYDPSFDTVKPNGKVIYLTFDDGPSIYTENLLNILESYKVKVTFFVTNQKPKYQHLIARMYRDGHTIGVHTLTHKWEIYDSVEAYLADFNAMNAIIEQQTGSPTRIFRFPGGTNNRVSTSHKKGIMTELSKMMVDNGYTYFDWNVSTNDTNLTDSSEIITQLISQVEKKNVSMILAHDIKKATINAMPGFIEYCLKNGYEFRAITESTEPVRFKPTN